MDLKKIISEVLNGKLNKKSCSCGCGGCDEVPLKLQLSLNENKVKKTTISEGLNWHLTHQKPLTEHLYRAGAQKYFNLWKEARSLYSRGLLEVNNPNDLELIKETNLGEFGIIYEIEIGDKVKASKEYGGLSGEVIDIRGSFIVVKTKEGDQSYHESDLKILNKEGIKVPLDFPILEENNKPTEQEIIDDILGEHKNLQEINLNKINEKIKSYAKQGLLTASILLSVVNNLHASNPQAAKDILKNNIEIVDSEDKKILYNVIIGVIQEYIGLSVEDGNVEIVTYLKELKQYYQNLKSGKEGGNLSVGAKKMEEIILKVIQQIPTDQLYSQYGLYNIKNKLEESKKENKPLNKPMRDSSGGKAYKVYVRDPKTKNIKTIRFGSGGLRAKLDNPEARKAFAARHKCGTGEPKTSARYWSCRIGRYWKQLGGNKNFSGYW